MNVMKAGRKRKTSVVPVTRREFVRISGAAALGAGVAGFPWIARADETVSRVIVLGIDGMDPTLVAGYRKKGMLPNVERLIQSGSYTSLGTSTPPQSPVAWSNFISGCNPGGHGIFDFIARDPATMLPRFSNAQTESASHSLRLGDWRIPLSKGAVRNLRRGPVLWEQLEENGMDSLVYRIPANFPPTGKRTTMMSGMGTPDVHGSYGVFSFYTDSPLSDVTNPVLEIPDTATRSDVAGGHVERIMVRDSVADCVLRGPTDSFSVSGRNSDIPFRVYVDPEHGLAKVSIQDTEFILKEGEWSRWVRLKFNLFKGLASVSGICRFYLKSVSKGLRLYVSPVNADPSNPSIPLCRPDDYTADLVEDLGLFYTQGMPQDTSALSSGVFDNSEYREQAQFVMQENLRVFEHELNRFSGQFMFYYFSALDLNCHMFWRCMDPTHPLYSPELAREQGDFIPMLYREMDRVIGRVLDAFDDKTLVLVVSDHGFTSFRRQFNLNSWLLDNGYASLRRGSSREETAFFDNVEWRDTKAYGLGINSLYLNVRGRECDGIVRKGEEYESLRAELIEKLTGIVDPLTGEKVIRNVFRPQSVYTGPYVDDAPDLVVAYNGGYRASWDTVLGKYPGEVILDNLDPWSGDHCMDPHLLSGVFMSNRKFQGNPSLRDMAPTIASAFGLGPREDMSGTSLARS